MTDPFPPEVLTLSRMDRERYLTALMAPGGVQDTLLALIAYNQELAHATFGVSEPMLGQIKLQWWIDAMPRIYSGDPPNHPVAIALAGAAGVLGEQQEALQKLAEARTFELEAGKPADLEALIRYAEASGGGLQGIWAAVLGLKSEAQIQAAHHVGTAWALIGIMRALPYVKDGGRDLLPKGVGVRDVLVKAEERLSLARTCRVPKAALSCVLLSRLADRHLKRLATLNWDPAVQEEPPAGAGVVLSLWWGKLSGRF
ncbi:squalene/phytoene synthase family protein [Magnetovibrio sp. PR-2]|uniref:squalene/phytoene synthase family protein n=1 Tax=Magnetovibrio sp. PR-2 TaxID=3120356 RepID=UPI002FCDE8AE